MAIKTFKAWLHKLSLASLLTIGMSAVLGLGTPTAHAQTSGGLGYTGEWQSADGCVYLRARIYCPHQRRFLQRDPYMGDIAEPASLNRQSYVHNNPALFTDPSGFCPKNSGSPQVSQPVNPFAEFRTGMSDAADGKPWNNNASWPYAIGWQLSAQINKTPSPDAFNYRPSLAPGIGLPAGTQLGKPGSNRHIDDFRDQARHIVDNARKKYDPHGINPQSNYGGKLAPIHGTGNAPGIFEIGARAKSNAAFTQLLRNGKNHEFVFLPKSGVMAINKHLDYREMGSRFPGSDGSPHSTIRSSLPKEELAVGGTIRQIDGRLYSDENSGHYGRNWTEEYRAEFRRFMTQEGFDIEHRSWNQ